MARGWRRRKLAVQCGSVVIYATPESIVADAQAQRDQAFMLLAFLTDPKTAVRPESTPVENRTEQARPAIAGRGDAV